MEETDKDWMIIRMVGGWMFLLVLAHSGSPGQKAIKRLLLCVVMHFLQFFVTVVDRQKELQFSPEVLLCGTKPSLE